MGAMKKTRLSLSLFGSVGGFCSGISFFPVHPFLVPQNARGYRKGGHRRHITPG